MYIPSLVGHFEILGIRNIEFLDRRDLILSRQKSSACCSSSGWLLTAGVDSPKNHSGCTICEKFGNVKNSSISVTNKKQNSSCQNPSLRTSWVEVRKMNPKEPRSSQRCKVFPDKDCHRILQKSETSDQLQLFFVPVPEQHSRLSNSITHNPIGFLHKPSKSLRHLRHLVYLTDIWDVSIFIFCVFHGMRRPPSVSHQRSQGLWSDPWIALFSSFQ